MRHCRNNMSTALGLTPEGLLAFLGEVPLMFLPSQLNWRFSYQRKRECQNALKFSFPFQIQCLNSVHMLSTIHCAHCWGKNSLMMVYPEPQGVRHLGLEEDKEVFLVPQSQTMEEKPTAFSLGTLRQKHARFLNTKSQLNFIIKGMWNADIQQLIFSSSCQVFLCKREIESKDVLIAKKV